MYQQIKTKKPAQCWLFSFNILLINLFHKSCLDNLAAVNQFDEIVA